MNFKKITLIAGMGLASMSHVSGQALVGAELPDPIGFTQAPPSFPLTNLSNFDFLDAEGEVLVVVYHASW